MEIRPSPGDTVQISGRDGDYEVVKVTEHHVGVRLIDRGDRPINEETGVDFAVHLSFLTPKLEEV